MTSELAATVNCSAAPKTPAVRVWVDDWQMQCCGDPFRVGGKVRWTVQAMDFDFARTVLGDTLAKTITHAEDHHGGPNGDVSVIEGTVTAIKAVHCKFAPRPGEDERTLYAVSGTEVIRELSEADRWEPEDDGLRFVAYLVDLDPSGATLDADRIGAAVVSEM